MTFEKLQYLERHIECLVSQMAMSQLSKRSRCVQKVLGKLQIGSDHELDTIVPLIESLIEKTIEKNQTSQTPAKASSKEIMSYYLTDGVKARYTPGKVGEI